MAKSGKKGWKKQKTGTNKGKKNGGGGNRQQGGGGGNRKSYAKPRTPVLGASRLWYTEDHSFVHGTEKSSRKVAATHTIVEAARASATPGVPAPPVLSHNGADLFKALPEDTRMKMASLELKTAHFVCSHKFYVTYCASSPTEGSCDIIVNSKDGRMGNVAQYSASVIFPHGDGSPGGVNLFVHEAGLKAGITGTIYTLTFQFDAAKFTTRPASEAPHLGALNLNEDPDAEQKMAQ